jgi:hypothetical protein
LRLEAGFGGDLVGDLLEHLGTKCCK